MAIPHRINSANSGEMMSSMLDFFAQLLRKVLFPCRGMLAADPFEDCFNTTRIVLEKLFETGTTCEMIRLISHIQCDQVETIDAPLALEVVELILLEIV